MQEEHLPLMGWPKRRIKGWWKGVCVCPWFRHAGDLLEPWLFLPSIFLYMWEFTLLQQWTSLFTTFGVVLAAVLTAGTFPRVASCCYGRRRRMRNTLVHHKRLSIRLEALRRKSIHTMQQEG